MSVIIDSLRPNSACVDDPPQKSRDKCQVDVTLHVGEQKKSISLQRSAGGFVYASDNVNSSLAFLASNGFDLLKPEFQGSVYYALSMTGTWSLDYGSFRKQHPKFSDYSARLDTLIQWINLGNISSPDVIQRENFRQCVDVILNSDSPFSEFLETELVHPLGKMRGRQMMTAAMQERSNVLQGILFFKNDLQRELSTLSPQNRLSAHMKTVLDELVMFVYTGDPQLSKIFEHVKIFSKALYTAKDVKVGTTPSGDLPILPLNYPKDLDPEKYNFFQVLAGALEKQDHVYSLKGEGEIKGRLELIVKWLKLDNHSEDLLGKKEEKPVPMLVPLPDVAATLDFTFPDDLPLLPDEPEVVPVKPVQELPKDHKPDINLFPAAKVEELSPQAFVVPPVVDMPPHPSQANKPWLLITEGSVCALGAVLTTVGALQKTLPGERNPLLISGSTMGGAGCVSLLVHLLSPKSWNPYVADGSSASVGAVAGFLIPWFLLSPTTRPQDTSPPSTNADLTKRNPTKGYGP